MQRDKRSFSEYMHTTDMLQLALENLGTITDNEIKDHLKAETPKAKNNAHTRLIYTSNSTLSALSLMVMGK